jgi:hypothetical protein
MEEVVTPEDDFLVNIRNTSRSFYAKVDLSLVARACAENICHLSDKKQHVQHEETVCRTLHARVAENK